MNNELTLATLRRQLAQRKIIDLNVHNLALAMLKPETKVQYRAGKREYFGRVIEIVGSPGRTQVRVQNVVTLKKRDIWLADVTGLVQEN